MTINIGLGGGGGGLAHRNVRVSGWEVHDAQEPHSQAHSVSVTRKPSQGLVSKVTCAGQRVER